MSVLDILISSWELKEGIMKKELTVVSLLLLLTAAAGADVYVKSKWHTDAMSTSAGDIPAGDLTCEQWFNDNQLAFINPKSSVIVDLNKNVLYLINTEQKSYVESTLPFDFRKLVDSQVAQMMSRMPLAWTVTPNGQTKMIGQWKCSGYDLTINSNTKTEVWASTDAPFNTAKFRKLYGDAMKAQMRANDASAKEIQKIKGYWISSKTPMRDGKGYNTNEVIEISREPAPRGVYSVTAGYTKKDKLSMEDMGRR